MLRNWLVMAAICLGIGFAPNLRAQQLDRNSEYLTRLLLAASNSRLNQTSKAGVKANYAYNPFGERILKTVGGSQYLYVYDEDGHVIGEYNGSGQLISEDIWLNDVPLAVIKPQSFIASHQGQAANLVAVFYIEHTALQLQQIRQALSA